MSSAVADIRNEYSQFYSEEISDWQERLTKLQEQEELAKARNEGLLLDELRRLISFFETMIQQLQISLDNCAVNIPNHAPNGVIIHDSKILEAVEKEKKDKFLNTCLKKGNWEKIYKSEASSTPKEFHKACDNQEGLLFILKSGEYTFGAYMSRSLTSSNRYKSDPCAFLFILQTPDNDRATIFPLKDTSDKCAIYDHENYFPTFGRGTVATGYDFYIRSNLDFTANLQTTYQDVLGKGPLTFTGVETASNVYFEVFTQR